MLEHHPPNKLQSLLDIPIPEQGQGKEGWLDAVKQVLHYSVNTWDQGFLDKLYASITPVGLASDLVLSTLNTNLHVYQVAPALITIEKQTGKALAKLFGLAGTFAGGVAQPGGSAANLAAMTIARNNLFPETKVDGYAGKKFVLFTSAHGHYSLEKAAQILGFGSRSVKSVPVDRRGCMRADALDEAVQGAKDAGETPFFVNATAGTTVLGSYDPLDSISSVCKKHKLWLHVDGSWGGPVIFSKKYCNKLKGSDKADSLALCPHKMLNIPLTCTYLLGKDLREFHKAMTLPAGYLFHDSNDQDPSKADSSDADPSKAESNDADARAAAGAGSEEVWDLADLTPQCGRRGDSLKLALSWTYYGTEGLGAYVDQGFEAVAYLASLVRDHKSFTLVSGDPPPCLQVCFYYDKRSGKGSAQVNSKGTAQIAKALIPRGFMVDYAPGEDGQFFRVVVNGQTRRATLDGLITAIDDIGKRT